MRNVLFLDTVCPKEYDPIVLATEGLGGTEATVLRVAENMSLDHARNVNVKVAQAGRDEIDCSFNAVYTPLKASLMKDGFYGIVVLRDPRVALNMRKYHKDSPIFLWCHDLFTAHFLPYVKPLVEAGVEIVVVSQFHKTNLLDIMRQDVTISKYPKVHVIYNPIGDHLAPVDGQKVDRNKLVFFSSPHKGLAYTLSMFAAARRLHPDFKLYVSNPGYYTDDSLRAIPEGVTNLGALSHTDALSHVRDALCVFYPNTVFPETFGLVFAEANAVGTPVLTHPIGAAREVLNGDFQLVDCNNVRVLLGRLLRWYDGGRPEVHAKPILRLSHVGNEWSKLLKL